MFMKALVLCAVGVGRFELPASSSRTTRANLAALHPGKERGCGFGCGCGVLGERMSEGVNVFVFAGLCNMLLSLFYYEIRAHYSYA